MNSREEDRREYEFRLDNSAKIFAAQLSRKRTTIFRLSAVIDKPVRLDLLQEAYRIMLDRCPYYRVHLRRGFFWYYFEYNESSPRVEAESRYPCLYIPYKRMGVLPFRVIAYRSRIAFEVAHCVTDGTGALWFLKGLLAEYLILRGETIDRGGILLNGSGPVDPAEFEESFNKYYEKGIPPARRVPPALQLRGKPLKHPAFDVIEGTMKSSDLKQEAVKHHVTIGEFLTALLIDVCREEMAERNLKPRPIRVSIPINLRQFYPSSTMRNFALAVEPEVDPRLGEFSFEEIIQKVHHFMRLELDHRYIRRQIARNIEGERHPLVRLVPLFIKDPVLSRLYKVFGRNAFTVCFSNLGRVTLPEDMQPYIRNFEFIPPPQEQTVGATSVAYGGYTRMYFATTMEERNLERRFFTRLRKMGMAVSIRTNRR